MENLKNIMIKYAQERGGGLPLAAQEICNAVVLWVQQYVSEESGVDVYKLAELIVGSETVVVDINETNDKLEIHLDGDVLSKIERAVLIPIASSTEARLPVLGVNREIEWAPVSSFVSGGGNLYKHFITCSKAPGAHDEPAPTAFGFTVYTTTPTPLGISQIIAYCKGAPALYETSSEYLTLNASSGVIADYDGNGAGSDLHIFYIDGTEFYADEFDDTVTEL